MAKKDDISWLALLGFLAIVLGLLLVAPLALGWTPESHQAIALDAARLAPPDLYRQLARNRAAYLQGVTDPFRDGSPELHEAGGANGRLDAAVLQSVDNAIKSIELLRPFNEIAYRLGVVSHYLADANDPLALADDDRDETRYRRDFQRYLESAEPRYRVVFYGFRPGVGERRDVESLLATTLHRGRRFYPLVGREYRRIGFASGVRGFDDRSTAYAVASLSRSHAVSDIAEMLRYIWLSAGGIDTRTRIPQRGENVIQLRPRTGR